MVRWEAPYHLASGFILNNFSILILKTNNLGLVCGLRAILRNENHIYDFVITMRAMMLSLTMII